MISLQSLRELALRHPEALTCDVEPIRIGGDTFAIDEPVIMATVNLSRDSTYRESIATSPESAIRKARVAHAQGAHLIDIGAESTTAKAARVTASEQIDRLLPVVSACTEMGMHVSAETYDPLVARACLAAGADVLNMTGAEHQLELLDLAAQFGATVILCYVGGGNVRDVTDVAIDVDPIPGLLEHFAARIDLARSRGVDRLVIDPGMGFYYGNLIDPMTRARHQAHVILQSFRLRVLGLPICHALPHAFDLFEDHFRTAEGFFAVLAQLGGAAMFRTHEVAHVRAVLSAMRELSP